MLKKSYLDVTAIIAILLFAIILFPLLPTIAYGQLFPFSSPTTNTTQDESTNSSNFSDYADKGQNSNSDNIKTLGDSSSTSANSDNNNDENVDNYYSSDSSSTNKVVILNFYDNDIGQFTNAKPILDKYRFKGTFFIVCKWATSDNPERMTWQEINQLYREGHDIEFHSTSHKVLNRLSADDLDYEVGQSKQCIYDHLGIYPTVFSPPHGKGWNNATVIDTIAKYYDHSIGGFVSSPMFLDCYGWKKQQQQDSPQTDCRTYSDDGELNYANRYDIKESSHNSWDTSYLHDDEQILERFVRLVDSQTNFNKDGKINAVPIIGYHNIEDDNAITSTHVSLFDAEMKYLYDNGFKVITMLI
jgi:peptidoglycan/xylan/chitin deacetylase (PgdA/CDA1 family)